MPEKKKMGRPTDSPKIHEVKTRVDDETLKILDDYCDKNNKKRAEGLRDGIHQLKTPNKKKRRYPTKNKSPFPRATT